MRNVRAARLAMNILVLGSRRTVPFWKFYITRFWEPFGYPLSYCFPFLLEPCPVHQIVTSDCRHPSLQARRGRITERWAPSSNSLSSGSTFRSFSRSTPPELKPTCRMARLPHSLSIRTDDASPFGDFPTHDRVLPSAHPIIGPVARDPRRSRRRPRGETHRKNDGSDDQNYGCEAFSSSTNLGRRRRAYSRCRPHTRRQGSALAGCRQLQGRQAEYKAVTTLTDPTKASLKRPLANS
jgi:hypothetical protein